MNNMTQITNYLLSLDDDYSTVLKQEMALISSFGVNAYLSMAFDIDTSKIDLEKYEEMIEVIFTNLKARVDYSKRCKIFDLSFSLVNYGYTYENYIDEINFLKLACLDNSSHLQDEIEGLIYDEANNQIIEEERIKRLIGMLSNF